MACDILKLPKLKFHELKDKTEEGFDKYLEQSTANHGDRYLVYIRQRYKWQEANDWEYLLEYLSMDWQHYDKIPTGVWERDWNEGQDIVEYLGVCSIDEDWEGFDEEV